MTKRKLTLSWILLATLLAIGTGHAQTRTEAPSYAPIGRVLGEPLHRFAVPDTIEIIGRRVTPPASWAANLTGSLAPTPDRQYRGSLLRAAMLRPRTYERTRAARIIYGADRFAGASAALGGLGLVSGLCSEQTAGYLMGAGAVLGALWGGTLGSNNAAIRIGIQSEPSVHEVERRSVEVPGSRR